MVLRACNPCRSLPTRGAWIEICRRMFRKLTENLSLPTRGAWIEIRYEFRHRLILKRRSPHGERGLKYPYTPAHTPRCPSLPTRGAWIEIPRATDPPYKRPSLPTRGAWIEINCLSFSGIWGHRRSPHGERGLKSIALTGVNSGSGRSPHGERGLKYKVCKLGKRHIKSLPTRGAWIEIGR